MNAPLQVHQRAQSAVVRIPKLVQRATWRPGLRQFLCSPAQAAGDDEMLCCVLFFPAPHTPEARRLGVQRCACLRDCCHRSPRHRSRRNARPRPAQGHSRPVRPRVPTLDHVAQKPTAADCAHAQPLRGAGSAVVHVVGCVVHIPQIVSFEHVRISTSRAPTAAVKDPEPPTPITSLLKCLEELLLCKLISGVATWHYHVRVAVTDIPANTQVLHVSTKPCNTT